MHTNADYCTASTASSLRDECLRAGQGAGPDYSRWVLCSWGLAHRWERRAVYCLQTTVCSLCVFLVPVITQKLCLWAESPFTAVFFNKYISLCIKVYTVTSVVSIISNLNKVTQDIMHYVSKWHTTWNELQTVIRELINISCSQQEDVTPRGVRSNKMTEWLIHSFVYSPSVTLTKL